MLSLLAHSGKITEAVAESTAKQPLGLHVESLRNDLAPYFVEEIRQYLEHTYGTAAVHEQGLRAYTTLNVDMQKAADRAVRDGLHAYDRRHGWRGNLPNILRDNLGTLDTYQNDDWKGVIQKGDYVTGLVTSVQPTFAYVKIGPYRALMTPADFAWTEHKSAAELVKPGDLVTVQIKELNGTAAEVELEQIPVAQAALIAIDNATGEMKAMVGGYDFEDSKFDRATQAMRQTGSSFKVYVYAEALAQGASPFDTVVDEPITFHTGSENYSPHNYDEKFEGRITLRRALADSRNVPAVRLLDKVGIENTVELARKFGLTSPLPPVLPLALGAADLTLIEHTSAFTVFPDDGIHIEPHYLRRVTSYDGAVMEELRPNVTDVIPPGSGAHDGCDARGRGAVRHGRSREGDWPSIGRQDRNNQRFHGRLVYRLHAANHLRRMGRQRCARHAGQERDRRARRASHLDPVYGAGHAGNAGGKFPECRPARETGGRASRAGGYAGYCASRRRRRAGSRGAARNRTFAITTGGVTIGAKASCCSATPGCGSSAIALDNLVLLFPAKRIPATRIERLAAAIGANECDPLAAFDLADRGDLAKIRRASQAFDLPGRHREKQFVILAAVQGHLHRIEPQLSQQTGARNRWFHARDALGAQSRADSTCLDTAARGPWKAHRKCPSWLRQFCDARARHPARLEFSGRGAAEAV